MTALNLDTEKLSKTAKEQASQLNNSAKESAEKINKAAKSKANELNKSAKASAVKLNNELDKKQTVFNGRLRQAKGLIREQVGKLTNNESLRKAGKREQVMGTLQVNYGNSWLARKGSLVLIGTAVATVLAVLFARRRTSE